MSYDSYDFTGKPGKRGLMMNDEKPPSPIKVEEKLTNLERRSVAYPDVLFLGTDDIGLMGPDLARRVVQKSFLVEIEMRKAYPDLAATKLEDICGVSTDQLVNVSTGEITFVGASHIEYNNNTFEGYAGAIVFLLDKHQPENLFKESDYGCAIAVHAGAHPYYNRNLAFVFPS
jgi:hypothetical protein